MRLLLHIAERLTWVLLATVVVVAARLWLGAWWPLWAAGLVAALSARRELSRLYLRPLPPAMRQALLAGPREETRPLRDLARRGGLAQPAVFYWPADDLPGGAPASHFLIQGRPYFLLSDALLDSLSPAEREAAFAHELAHHLLGHVRKFALACIAADAAAGAVACVAASDDAIRLVSLSSAPALAAAVAVVWIIARSCFQVALNAYSRRQELAADRKSLEITGDPEAFRSANRNLAGEKGAAARAGLTHTLLSDSPTLAQRLAVAEEKP